jgi:hypothetical protein
MPAAGLRGRLADVVAPDLRYYPPKTRFRRGFVDRAWFISPDDFLHAAPGLFTRAPITGISLWSPCRVPPGQEAWFQNTYLAVYCHEHGLFQQPREPGGTEFPAPDEFRRLVASPLFARLNAFAMGSIYADRRHLEILTASLAATQRANGIGPECLHRRRGDAAGRSTDLPAAVAQADGSPRGSASDELAPPATRSDSARSRADRSSVGPGGFG